MPMFFVHKCCCCLAWFGVSVTWYRGHVLAAGAALPLPSAQPSPAQPSPAQPRAGHAWVGRLIAKQMGHGLVKPCPLPATPLLPQRLFTQTLTPSHLARCKRLYLECLQSSHPAHALPLLSSPSSRPSLPFPPLPFISPPYTLVRSHPLPSPHLPLPLLSFLSSPSSPSPAHSPSRSPVRLSGVSGFTTTLSEDCPSTIS